MLSNKKYQYQKGGFTMNHSKVIRFLSLLVLAILMLSFVVHASADSFLMKQRIIEASVLNVYWK